MFKNTVSNSVLAHPLCNNEFNNCALLKHTYLNKFLIFGDWGEMCKSTQKKVSNDISLISSNSTIFHIISYTSYGKYLK